MPGGLSEEQVNGGPNDSLGVPNIIIHCLSPWPNHLGPAVYKNQDAVGYERRKLGLNDEE